MLGLLAASRSHPSAWVEFRNRSRDRVHLLRSIALKVTSVQVNAWHMNRSASGQRETLGLARRVWGLGEPDRAPILRSHRLLPANEHRPFPSVPVGRR
jgi:hypothetical protein